MSLEKLQLEIGVETVSHKKIAFHQSNSELGRKRKTSEALVTSLTSTAESENSYLSLVTKGSQIQSKAIKLQY